MSDPNPMDTERLALLKSQIELTAVRHWSIKGEHDPTNVAELLAELAEELLDDRDLHRGRATRYGEELAPLLDAAANAGSIADLKTGESASIDALVNAGASLMIAALQAHPKAENGIRVDVTVNPGERPASVFVQYGHDHVLDVVGHITRIKSLEAQLESARGMAQIVRRELEDRNALADPGVTEARYTDSGARLLPTANPRVETGRVQFAEDWSGVFIRGDNVAGLMLGLRDAAREVTSSAAKIAVANVTSLLKGVGRDPTAPSGAKTSDGYLDVSRWAWSEDLEEWRGPGDHSVALCEDTGALIIEDWHDVADAPAEVCRAALDGRKTLAGTGEIEPTTVLIEYDGPLLFRSVGVEHDLLVRVSERGDGWLCLAVPTTDDIIGRLEAGALTVRGALTATTSRPSLVKLRPSAWSVESSEILADTNAIDEHLPPAGLMLRAKDETSQ